MKKLISILMMSLILATVLPMVNIASAITINSQAEVSTTAQPPLVKYKWELTEGGQCSVFTNQVDCESHYSCKWTGTCTATLTEGYYLVEDDISKLGTQVMPKPCDNSDFNTGIKDVRVYMVVWSPWGISDIAKVHVKKYEIDNVTLREESDAIDITGSDTNADGLIEPSEEANHAIAAAVHYNLITFDQAYNSNTGIIENIKQKQYKVYREIDKMDCCDVAGMYNVLVRVTGSTGAFSEFYNQFEYYSLKALRTDFTSVNYGLIPIGMKKWVAGDYNFGTSAAPTVRNNGNDPYRLNISATDLTNLQYPNYKILVNYLDSWFMGYTIDPLSYSRQTFNPTGSMFDACSDQKIDFSINAPSGTSAGTYSGTIYLQPV